MVITSIGIIIMTFIVFQTYKQNLKNEKSYNSYVEKVIPLYEQLNSLEKELSIMEEKFASAVVPKATVQIVFTELDTRVYDVCYNLMKQREFIGVLALSDNELPGESGCMSNEQFNELINAGWSTCILLDDYVDVSSKLQSFTEKLNEMGIEVPSVLFISDGLNSFESKFESHEYDIVIYEGSNNSSVIQTSIGTKIWYLGAVGLRSSYAKRLLTEAVEYRGNIAFLVGYSQKTQMYSPDYFITMLDELETHSGNGDLIICSPTKAKEHYIDRKSSKSQEEIEQYNSRKAEIEAEIDIVKQKIEDAYFESQ